MKYSLTDKQKNLARWIVKAIREEDLPETFAVQLGTGDFHDLASGKIFSGPVADSGMMICLQQNGLVVLGKGFTTITANLYAAVDSDFKDETLESSASSTFRRSGNPLPKGDMEKEQEADVLEAKAPEILQKLKWLRLFGWQYKGYISAACLLAVLAFVFNHLPNNRKSPDPIVGTWKWYGSQETGDAMYTTFHPDGSAWSGNKSNGTWRLIDSTTRDYSLEWPVFGSTNFVTLSLDGRTLTEHLTNQDIVRTRSN